MDPITGIVAGLSLTIITVVSVVLFINNSNAQQNIDSKVASVVNQLNDSQYYAYKFDQTQQSSLGKADKRIQEVDERVTSTNAVVESNKKQVDASLSNMRSDYLRKDDVPKGVPFVKTGRMQVSEDYLFGGGSDSNLGIYDKKGEKLATGLSVRNLKAYNEVSASNFVTKNASIYNTLSVRSDTNSNAAFTAFRVGSSNNIVGNTSLTGNFAASGNVVAGSNMSVQGRIHFRDLAFSTGQGETNNSDPYYLEKVVTGENKSSLRLTINNDSNESLQIWGNACGTGNCLSQGALAHSFIADGRAVHTGPLDAKSISAATTLSASNAAWLSADGIGYVANKFGVGIAPTTNTSALLSVNGGVSGNFSTVINNDLSTVSMAKNDGDAIRVETKSAKQNTRALYMYSAAGDLFDVRNNGSISFGISNNDTASTIIHSKHTRLGGNLDAWDGGSGTSNASLSIGNASGKVIIGNNAQTGQLYARNNTPARDAVVVTNPLYINKSLYVDRSSTDPKPASWNGSGVFTSQMLANKVSVVQESTGLEAAYINTNGTIQGNLLNTTSDKRLKDDITTVPADEASHLSKLRPVSYTMKTDPKKNKRYGFISQEVQDIYPNLVYQNRDGTQSLDYTGMIPLVVNRVNDISKAIPSNNKEICLGSTCITENELRKLKNL